MTRKRPKVTLEQKPAVRFRAYSIIADAVERGVAYGWMRAFKHESNPIPKDGPRAAHAREEIENAVTTAISEVMEFAPFVEEEER